MIRASFFAAVLVVVATVMTDAAIAQDHPPFSLQLAQQDADDIGELEWASSLGEGDLLAQRRKGKAKSPRSTGSSSRGRYTSSIETNPLGLLFGFLNAEYNMAFGNNLTIGPMGQFFTFGLLSGFGVGVSSYYYSSKLFEGLYFHGTANYSSVSFTLFEETEAATGIGIAGVAGYKWLWPSGFLLSLGGGLQYYSFDILDVPISGVGLALEFNIGIAL